MVPNAGGLSVTPYQPASVRHPRSTDARQLAELARAAGLGGSPEEALRWNRDTITLLAGEEESTLLVDVLRWQGSVFRDRGRTPEAEPLYRQSLEMATRIGYDAGIGHALNCLASLAHRRGDLALASNLVTEALVVAEHSEDRRLLGMLQQNLGMFADMRGNPAAAQAHYRESLRIFESMNDEQLVCWMLNNLGLLLLKDERFDEAREAFVRALETSRERGDLMTEGVIEENLGELELMRGAVANALGSIGRAYEVATQRGDHLRRAAALKLRGAYQRMVGWPAEATNTLREALLLSARGEDALLAAEVMYQFGVALYTAGERASAHKAWTAAMSGFERMGATPWVDRVRARLSSGVTGRYL